MDDNFDMASGFYLLDLGVSEYESVYELQLKLLEEKKKFPENQDHLIFVEHPDVYTYGRKGQPAPDDSSRSFAVERGGEATFHNVGQLVSYPILSLNEKERDLHLHLRRLEYTLIDTLKDFEILGERREGATGVWVEEGKKKIASIGVAVSSWVTYHGSALNVNNDLSGFSKINPCGYPSSVMTSMRELLGSHCPTIPQVKESFLRHFIRQFDRSLVI